MELGLASLLIFAALVTAFISGIFGLAGGMLLMGLLTLVLPVEAAFVTHGIVQLVANGWRAILHREFVKLQILGWFALATGAAASIMILIGFVPPKALVFALMGLLPVLLWLPSSWFTPDASRPTVALSSGFLAGLLNLTAGVSGPLIDTVFVRTGLNRHQIVATKGAIQTLNHFAKIGVFGLLLAHGGNGGNGDTGLPPYWFFMLIIPASMLGTTAGGLVLDRLSDASFKRWTAWIVTAIGVFYLWKAWDLWF